MLLEEDKDLQTHVEVVAGILDQNTNSLELKTIERMVLIRII